MNNLIAKFKKLGPEIFIKKMLAFEPVFTCAVRLKDGHNLYENATDSPFYVMPDSKEYWYADPLFYEYNGKTVLFMEAVNYKSQRGKIVCSEIRDLRFSRPKTVIEESFHLSFPNIFSFKDELYMIPEAEESGGIVIYKCEQFPTKWKQIAHIKTEVPVVDSVIEYIDGDIIQFSSSTYDDNPLSTKYYYYQLDFSDPEHIVFTPHDSENESLEYSYEYRNGGRYIQTSDDRTLHCVQTSTQAVYGYSLKFFPVQKKDSIWSDLNQDMIEITPDKINLANRKYKLMGLHTYTESSLYEAIDIERFEWRPQNWLLQFHRLIHR